MSYVQVDSVLDSGGTVREKHTKGINFLNQPESLF